MTDFTWVLGFLLNLVGVIFAVIQTRVSLERRISVLETYMKILLRDKGVTIRSTDTLAFKYEQRDD